MTRRLLGKIAGVLLLTGGLAACVDVDVDVNVVSQTTAKATMTQIMGAEFYAMVKSGQTETAGEDEFCAEGTLTENPDGSATCVLVEEGPFATLTMGNDNKDESVQFASAGPGLVRVSLSTASMKADLSAEEDLDAETKQMVEAFFTGHNIIVRFAGKEVVETNMTPSDDKTSAEEILPFVDIINGTAELPDELYAVVRVE